MFSQTMRHRPRPEQPPQPPEFQIDYSRPAKFSEGEDGSWMTAETATLLESKWALDETQQGLEKTFNFPTYAKALVSNFLLYGAVANL